MNIKIAVLFSFVTSSIPGFGAYDPANRVNLLFQQSEAMIAQGKLSLARSMLDAVVTSPYLSARQRARAFYARGYSFQSEAFYTSAALDYSRALEFDSNNSSSLTALAGMYANCLGVICDPIKAYRYALMAARGGNKQGKLLVGTALLYGKGTPKNLSKAQYWLKEAAVSDNYTDAYTHYAMTFRRPYSKEPDSQKALFWYEKAENLGDEKASLAIAYMHRDGEFEEVSVAKAVQRFSRLAKAGNAAAQVALAHIHLTDEKNFHDLGAALHWYTLAANQQVEAAFVGLGYMYENGIGVAPNISKAIDWYTKGAQLGYPAVQLKLGLIRYRSAATETQARQALVWLTTAAAQESPSAMNAVAWIYATSKYASLRNGSESITLGTRANQILGGSATLDTLAAGYAETGNYEKAIALQRSIVTNLEATPALHNDYTERLEAYLEKRPWRE